MTKIIRSHLQLCLLLTKFFLLVVTVVSQQMSLEERLSSSHRQKHEENPSLSSQIPPMQPQEYQHYYDYKTKLPRVEVQLLCSHDVPSDFDVSETFRQFYQEFFLAALAHNDNDDKEQLQESDSTTETIVMLDNVDDDASPFDTELFTFVSRSNVYDVKPREDFYDLCDPTSTTVLVTMDVRGYIHVRTNEDTATNVQVDGPLDGFRTHDNLQRLMDQVNPSAIKDFFALHVCSSYLVDDDDDHQTNNKNKNRQANMDQNSTDVIVVGTDIYDAMEYFKAKVQPWNTRLAPPPPSGSRDYPYPSTQDHRHFDHNLRLLCNGGVDAVYPNYHKQAYRGPDNITSLVIGLLVGMIMVGMIWKEWKQKRPSSVRDRRRRMQPGQHNRDRTVVDDSATISSESQVNSSNLGVMEYEETPTDETQTVV
jgi:hypothetical protein